MWHARASSGASGDKLAAARLDLELSKLAREKAEADAVAQKAKAEADAVARKYEIETEVAFRKGMIEVDAAKAEVMAVAAKAEAEMGAAKAKAGTDAAKAEVEVGAAKSKAGADAAKAEVELGAAKAKAGADAAKAGADAAKAGADAAKAEVEMGAAKARVVLLWIPWLSAAAIVAVLAVDYYVHESTAFIKHSMRTTLRKCRLPPSLPLPPTVMLPVSQLPLTLGFLPILLLGPSGCGKSTLLGRIASSLPTPAPVVLVRMRLPSAQTSGDTPPVMDANTLMDATANQVFSQIGFPMRRSFLAGILSHDFTLRGEQTKVELVPESRGRLVTALRLLFEVCEELKLERQKSMSPLDAAPVLLFDEVQDLIKDARLKNAGGQIVLDLLGSMIVSYCVDRRAVRAVVAGSSAELQFAFAASTPLRGPRWECFDLEDPDHGAVITALQAGGYSAEEAHSMTNLCGTRLRLLQGPLTKGKRGEVSAADFLSKVHTEGRAAFASVFFKLNVADAKLLAKFLDDIEVCDSGQGIAERPDKRSLPAALHHVDIAPILYVNREREFFFQSQLHRRTWAQVRDKYLQSPRLT